MKFGGSFNSNWSNAIGSKNTDLQRDLILDEVGRLIETDRPAVISALKDSGYTISPSASKKEVINKTVSALYRSKQFKLDVAKAIVKNDTQSSFAGADGNLLDKAKGLMSSGGGAKGSSGGGGGDFWDKIKDSLGGIGSGSSGSGSGGGTASGGLASTAGAGASGGIAGAIAGAIGAIFTFGASRQNRKAEEERAKQELYNKLLTDKEQTNWIPVIVIGGVILIGGIVAFFALRNNK